MQTQLQIRNELHIGNRLNLDIVNQRRGDFALILAMLSEDVRDMAQFQLNKDKSAEQKLSEQLQIPKPQTLIHDLSADPIVIDHAHLFHRDGQTQFNFCHSVTPEPLLTRGQFDEAMQIALSNVDFNTLLKASSLANANRSGPDAIEHVVHNDYVFVEELEKQRAMGERVTGSFSHKQ